MQETRFNTMGDLMLYELRDMLSAEQQLGEELPKMADAAMNSELKQDLKNYTEDARKQAENLRQTLQMLNQPVEVEKCEGMEGLVEEGDETIKASGSPHVKDAAIIAAVQRMKHYEIAGYGCLRTYADMLGQKQIAEMAADTLHEEERIDKELTVLAMNTVNPQAMQAA